MTATNLAPKRAQEGDIPFTDRDFRRIADLARARYGLFLQPSKKALVYSRLSKRLRALDIPSFEEYCTLLDRADAGTEEPHLLSALTTNVTHFFREIHHFDMLSKDIAPQLLQKAQTGTPVRLWSAACSAGQEAYCMAAALVAGAPDLQRHDVKILATDIDPTIIKTARAATYPADQREAIPDIWRDHLLATTEGEIAIRADLREMISFGELNLIDAWPMKRRFDVIFCRNAAIYFDKQTQARLWQRFADAMCPGGHLMIGHSERMSGPAAAQFESAGITTYRKHDTATAASQPQLKEH